MTHRKKLADDFEVRHTHRELKSHRRINDEQLPFGGVIINDESGLEIGETGPYRQLQLEGVLDELDGYDPRNHFGSRL